MDDQGGTSTTPTLMEGVVKEEKAANAGETFPGKRNGVPQMEVFAREGYRKSLQNLVNHLKTSITDFAYDTRSLANLLSGMQQFVESAYGKDALTKPFPKLPFHVFNDTRPGGAIGVIARVCAGSLNQKKQKKIDWMSPANRRENQELIARVRQELLRAGCMRNPKIYLDSSKLKNESLVRLRKLVTKLGGQLAQSPTDNGVTHVVVPNTEEQEIDDVFWRTIEINKDLGLSRVHWWYLPDSYNEWVPVHAAPSDIDPDVAPPNSKPWYVHERWVVDSEKYNEWMNEGDYETEESSEENKKIREAKSQQEKGIQKKDDGPQRKKTKKEIWLADIAAEVAHGATRVIDAGVIEREVIHVQKKIIDGHNIPAIDLSHGYRQQWMGNHYGQVEEHATTSEKQEEMRHAIPFAASWFNTDDIHHIEVREFFEFQKGVKGPGWAEYRIMRNHIVSMFQKHPTRRLAFSDISGMFYADSFLVLKIYKFLNRWGIINYFDIHSSGFHPRNLEYTNRAGLDSILSLNQRPFSTEKALEIWIGGGRNSKARVRPGSLTRIHSLPTGQAIPDTLGPFCTSRPWIRCTGDYYVCKSDEMIVLCQEAYSNGEFAPGTSVKDYYKRNTANSSTHDTSRKKRKQWSSQEDLLLLEAILKNKQVYKESIAFKWDKIAAAVGSRTEAECVQRFLEYPIEESLILGALDLSEHFPSVTLGSDGKPVIPERYKRAPYNSVDLEVYSKKEDTNPLIANLTAILYIVGPEVASVAAQQALECSRHTSGKDIPQQKEKSEDTNPKTHPMRYGVDISLLRQASFEAITKASIRAQDLAQERLQAMYSIMISMCEVQLERIWEKCDYLDALADSVLGKGLIEAALDDKRRASEALAKYTAAPTKPNNDDDDDRSM